MEIYAQLELIRLKDEIRIISHEKESLKSRYEILNEKYNQLVFKVGYKEYLSEKGTDVSINDFKTSLEVDNSRFKKCLVEIRDMIEKITTTPIY